MVCYSHHFKDFPQFIVIHTVRGCSTVHEAEVNVFLAFSFFLHESINVGNWISGSFAFAKSSFYT